MVQACKPGSVPRQGRGAYHLSGPALGGINRSTRPGIRGKSELNQDIHSQDLFDLSTHKVFRAPGGYNRGGGLLPRLFTITLTVTVRATCSLWHYLYLALSAKPPGFPGYAS